jgi:hypothetical protein
MDSSRNKILTGALALLALQNAPVFSAASARPAGAPPAGDTAAVPPALKIDLDAFDSSKKLIVLPTSIGASAPAPPWC